MTDEKKPRIGQFTLTKIDNGWLVRYDFFVKELNTVIPSITYHKTLDECFKQIEGLSIDREEPKIKVATSMPKVAPPANA